MRPSANPRQLTELTRSQALDLLAGVPLGRIVFTHRALPAIRPVNHILDGEDVIIRSHDGAAIVSATAPTSGTVVVYEADAIDPVSRLGWSVIVTGTARHVTDYVEISRYRQLLDQWVATEMDWIVRIHAELVTGYRLDPQP